MRVLDLSLQKLFTIFIRRATESMFVVSLDSWFPSLGGISCEFRVVFDALNMHGTLYTDKMCRWLGLNYHPLYQVP
jgi:hypothetical protein